MKLGAKVTPTVDGRFRGSFIPAGSTDYRYYVMSRADAVTARGATTKYALRVPRTRGGGVAAPRR